MLFPRLRAANSGAVEDLERLESDHGEANLLHASVEQLYTAWIANGRLDAEDQGRLMRETKTLKQLYYEHIQAEETLIFALATQVLDREALAQIGLEFQLRRK